MISESSAGKGVCDVKSQREDELYGICSFKAAASFYLKLICNFQYNHLEKGEKKTVVHAHTRAHQIMMPSIFNEIKKKKSSLCGLLIPRSLTYWQHQLTLLSQTGKEMNDWPTDIKSSNSPGVNETNTLHAADRKCVCVCNWIRNQFKSLQCQQHEGLLFHLLSDDAGEASRGFHRSVSSPHCTHCVLLHHSHVMLRALQKRHMCCLLLRQCH